MPALTASKWRFGLLFFFVFATFAAMPTSASANAFRDIGYDSLTQALGNGNLVYGDSLGVLYTNPALLPRFPEQAAIGITFMKPNFHVRLKPKPAGTDVPITLYASRMGNEDSQQNLALPTVELKNQRADTNVEDPYAWVGFGTSMAIAFEDFRFATLMMIPIDSLKVASTRSHYANELEQYFTNKVHLTRFGEWGRILDGLFGVAYKPWDFLSFGVSLKIGLSAVAKVGIYVPDATVQDYTVVNNGADMALALKPIVGIQAEPTDWLALGVTWRHWSYMDLEGDSDMGLWQFHETSNDYIVPKIANQYFRMAIDYEPMEFAFGIGAKTHGFKTQVGVNWEMWHFYLDEHHQKPHKAAHFPPSPFQADPIAKDDCYKFKDTFEVKWSGQYKYIDKEDITGEVMAAFVYSPSPVPAQTGRTNYADSDLFMGSVGNKLDFVLFEQNFGVDFAFQYWHMLEREVFKNPRHIVDEFADQATTNVGNETMDEAQGLQTNNPGFPGYSVGGYSILASINLRYQF